MTRVKICCIADPQEAGLAIKYGASAIGLVSEMPSGPGVISEQAIIEIAETVPPGIATFLLTSKRDVSEIIQQQRKCRTDTIQICDTLNKGSHKELKDSLPGIKIVQVIHVAGEESIEEAINVSANVHAILLDSGNRNLSIKELGGTGRTHNWKISREIVKSVGIPVYLAGGLNPENVADAIKRVEPFGVDICSGVRTGGKLDEDKLKLFFDKFRSADNE